MMNYLNVLKTKISDMELKVREAISEKNFYQERYRESENII